MKTETSSQVKKSASSIENSEDDIPIAQLCDDVDKRDICGVWQEFGRDREI